MECLFCRIIKKEIPSKSVYEDKDIYAFYDIQPQAKKHILIVPKTHIENLHSLPETSIIMNQILLSVKKIVKLEGLDESGYRLVVNNGKDALQSVQHLHFHVMGGNVLSGKMG
jgi:histidine triad (HIT) family protein